MQNKILFFTLFSIFSLSLFAQKPDFAKNNALNRYFSLSVGGYYTQVLGDFGSYNMDTTDQKGNKGTKTYSFQDSLGFSSGYGISAKMHFLFRGFRHLGLTLGWDIQRFNTQSAEKLHANLFVLGIKLYPAKKWYIGIEGILSQKYSMDIKKSAIGGRLSLNKEFLLFTYPFEVNVGGQIQQAKIDAAKLHFTYYNVIGGLSVRI